MSILNQQDHCEVEVIVGGSELEEFINTPRSGIKMVPELSASNDTPALRPDAGDFAKWLRQNHPNLDVDLPEANCLVLRSAEIWLPLVILATDIGLPIYLNMVSSYLYERARGLIGNEQSRVDLRVEYRDGELTKRLSFRGSADELAKLSENLGLKGYFSDTNK